MEKLKAGFYTALGTPLDKDGNVIEASLRKHIDMQIEAGASGLLLLGSMGIQSEVKNSAWAEAVKIAADAVKGRASLFVGAMDNSTWRVKDRLDMIKGLNIDGIVLTTPFYSVAMRHFVAFKASNESSNIRMRPYSERLWGAAAIVAPMNI